MNVLLVLQVICSHFAPLMESCEIDALSAPEEWSIPERATHMWRGLSKNVQCDTRDTSVGRCWVKKEEGQIKNEGHEFGSFVSHLQTGLYSQTHADCTSDTRESHENRMGNAWGSYENRMENSWESQCCYIWKTHFLLPISHPIVEK